MAQQNKSNSLTEGSVARGMLLFAIPIFISNLFQQLYNAADSLIVGNFLGGEALAAVGSSSSLIFLLTGFVNGVDRYVVNMPWKEKRDFFERMARYVLRILNNTEKGEPAACPLPSGKPAEPPFCTGRPSSQTDCTASG